MSDATEKNDPHAAIERFWQWWPTVEGTIAQSFRDTGLSDELIAEMNTHVKAIDESLDWEFGPGEESEHHLCVSAHGDPELRVIAERWFMAAPNADDTWEFYPSRQAHPTPETISLQIVGHEVAFSDFQFAIEVDEAREVADISIHHPAFTQIDDENLRGRIAFIGLDNILGEDDVERWLGSIEVSQEPLDDPKSLEEFSAALDDIAENATGDSWAVAKGMVDGKPLFVSFNQAVKRVDNWLLDTELAVTIDLKDPSDQGLPDKEEGDALAKMEDALVEQMDEDAVYVGRETHDGKRTLFFHVMESGPTLDIVDRWSKAHPDRAIRVEVKRDPSWTVLQRWG